MLTKPTIETMDAQPYLAIQINSSRQELPLALPPLIEEVANWMETQGIAAEGPPFFRYKSMDSAGQMDVEVGFPVFTSTPGAGNIRSGSFEAGRYVVVTYTGDYTGLEQAHQSLENWVASAGLQCKQSETEAGITWNGRIEYYVTDPEEEPDSDNWITEVHFLLAN